MFRFREAVIGVGIKNVKAAVAEKPAVVCGDFLAGTRRPITEVGTSRNVCTSRKRVVSFMRESFYRLSPARLFGYFWSLDRFAFFDEAVGLGSSGS